MVWWWWVIPGVVAVLAAVLLLGGLGWIFRGRPGKGGRGVIFGALFGAIAFALAMVGLDIQTYNRLSFERPIATLDVVQRGTRHYDVTLTQPPTDATPEGVTQVYPLHGDHWRIEARVLRWKPWANVLGLDSQYQLERLSGRYADVSSEISAERSVHDLRPESQSRIDLWQVAQEYGRHAPVVDTLYGSGAYMPMANGARYEVWITQSGLVARPVNQAAMQASATGWE